MSMFGIDIGISVSSVSCVGEKALGKYRVLDYQVLLGNKRQRNEWKRIVDMADGIVDAINIIIKGHPKTIIQPLVAIEEPVYPYRTRNPRSYFNMCCLYALIRNKLTVRQFHIYSINPVSAKSTAKTFLKTKRLSLTYASKRGRLTKKGMMLAYEAAMGEVPPGRNNVVRETLADSFFIALNAIERHRIGMK